MLKIKLLIILMSPALLIINGCTQKPLGKISPNNELYRNKIASASHGETVNHDDLMNAIFILGETQDKKAIPALIKLLTVTTDLAIGNACIVALGGMAADDAMQPIIEFVERKPPIIRRQAIIAAKRIASKLALEWLLVMAYGHNDPLVRQEALSAFHEVEKKLATKPN